MLPKKITDYDVLKKHYTFLNDEVNSLFIINKLFTE